MNRFPWAPHLADSISMLLWKSFWHLTVFFLTMASISWLLRRLSAFRVPFCWWIACESPYLDPIITIITPAKHPLPYRTLHRSKGFPTSCEVVGARASLPHIHRGCWKVSAKVKEWVEMIGGCDKVDWALMGQRSIMIIRYFQKIL